MFESRTLGHTISFAGIPLVGCLLELEEKHGEDALVEYTGS
jgi:hypothetical protein